MLRDPWLYLEDLETACRKIVHFTAGCSRQDFLRDELTYDAVIRNLEVIGLSAKNMPEEIKKRFATIQWRELTALGSMVSRDYFGMSDDIIWDLVENKVPEWLKLVTHVMYEIKLNS